MADRKVSKEGPDRGEAPRRLLRSSSERVLAGVAGGLGRHLGIDPTLVRLGFVAAAFFGGFGVLAYLVMVVVVPEDDGTGRPVADRSPPIWALILLGVALLFALPGPFWGWGWGGHGWRWGFAGPIWIAILIAAAIWAYRALSSRGALSGRTSSGHRRAGGDRPRPPAEAAVGAERAPRALRAIAIVVLVLAGVAAAASLVALSAWATATGNGAVVAGAVIALGAALAATAFFADGTRQRNGAVPRTRSAPWLLALALLLALPAGAVAAADIRIQGGIGEREYRPAAAADIPADGYELGVGRLVVDLRGLTWRDGEVVSLESDLGIGQMVVSVPREVCVVGEADAKAGELLVRGHSNSGVDPEFRRGDSAGAAPRLDLDAQLQLGQVVVTEDGPDEVREHGGDDPDEAAAVQEACER